LLHRVQARLGAAGAADLRVDVLDVVARRLRGYHQPVGDLLVGMPLGRECEHFDLASGQPRRPLAAASHAMPGGTKHGMYSVAVEPAGPDLVPQ
jgi:hypothetical protein